MSRQTIKLSDDVMSDLRAEAPVFSRSLAGQAEHWLKIGMAVERSPGFDYHRIKAALKGEVRPDDLSGDEQVIFQDAFVASLWEPSDPAEAALQERREKGLGAGLDEAGKIVRQTDLA
jgi:hypothetical protein